MKPTHTEKSKANARTGWTEADTRSLVSLYFHLRRLEILGSLGRGAGKTTKKAQVTEWRVDNPADGAELMRSHGSVECKLMNISAALAAIDRPEWIVSGYKPLQNRSADLDRVVASMVPEVDSRMVRAARSEDI